MAFSLCMIKFCLLSGLFLLVFFGLFFQLLESWCFPYHISSAVVTDKNRVSRHFIIQVETENKTLSFRCCAQQYEAIQPGDTVSLVCRGGRIKQFSRI